MQHVECAALPPSNKRDAIPLEATFKTINPCDLIAADRVFQMNVLPVPPFSYKK